ncbi:hypothetical protein BGZ93_003909 [Podila epicladia]|nr:hypothetical protein BGZ92_008402 [Podila epicladia]KAG0096832.1 hypothetical protein BGZ93_003909 [Podila epicladia]
MKNLNIVSLVLTATVFLSTTTSAHPVDSRGYKQNNFHVPFSSNSLALNHCPRHREVSDSPELEGHVLIRFNAKKHADIDLGLNAKDKLLYSAADDEPVDILLSQLDVWSQSKDKTDILAHLSKEQYNLFKRAMIQKNVRPGQGQDWELVDADLRKSVLEESAIVNAQETINRGLCLMKTSGAEAGTNQIKPSRVDLTTWFGNYHPYEAIKEFYLQLAEDYEDLVTFIPSIGMTAEGRDIFAVKITAREEGGAIREKPQIWWQSLCTHHQFWLQVQYLTHHLLSKYGKKEKITSLLQDAEFVIVPIMNIDGYDYTWKSNRLWRKNRRHLGPGTYGVDLNRNWNDHFGQGGLSRIPWSETYRGPSAASEPEVRALAQFFSAQKRVIGAIDFHTYSQLVLRPKGWSTEEAPHEKEHKYVGDKIAEAIKAVHGMDYISERTIELYEMRGSAADWFYGEEATKANNGRPVYSYAIELRPNDAPRGFKGFLLPPEEIIPLGEEMAEAMEFFADYVVKHPLEPK